MRLVLLILMLALLTGCNRSPPAQIPARGHVVVNGNPLRGGTVVFTPDVKRGARGPVAFAVLDENGGFELATEIGPGAVRGWHRVTVAPPPASVELLAGLERYRNPELSGISFEVKAGQPNDFTITLEWEQ